MQLDPLTFRFPFLTPFQYASGDPITNIDMDGLEGWEATAAKSLGWSSEDVAATALAEVTVSVAPKVALRAVSVTSAIFRGLNSVLPVLSKIEAVHSEESIVTKQLNEGITATLNNSNSSLPSNGDLQAFDPNVDNVNRQLTPDNIGGNAVLGIYQSVQGAKESVREGNYGMAFVYSFNTLSNTVTLTGGGPGYITKGAPMEFEMPSDAGQLQKAQDAINFATNNNGAARSGYKGNKTYENDGRQGSQILPKTDEQGNSIKYKEYDINPFQKGVNRGEERVVIGDNGKAYLTSNHYQTFTELRK